MKIYLLVRRVLLVCYMRLLHTTCTWLQYDAIKRTAIDESMHGMIVCIGFIALLTTVLLGVRCQDLLLSVSARRIHVVFSTARFKGGRKLCHVKPPRCGETFRKPRALSRDRTQAI